MRLIGPWDYQVLSGQTAGDRPPTGRLRMPTDRTSAFGPEFVGAVRLRRRFNRPTNLDPHERVWLVIEGVEAGSPAALNGSALGEVGAAGQPVEFDVTGRLAMHNELAIDIVWNGQDGAAADIFGDVRLEIRFQASNDDSTTE